MTNWIEVILSCCILNWHKMCNLQNDHRLGGKAIEIYAISSTEYHHCSFSWASSEFGYFINKITVHYKKEDGQ